MKKTAKIHEEREEELEEEEEKNRGVWDCGSPLYDSYELASLSSIIEKHLMKVPSLGRSKRVAAAITAAANQASQRQPIVISASSRSRSAGGNSNKPSKSSSMEGKKKKEKGKRLKNKFYVIFSKIGLLKKEAKPNEMI